MSIRIVTSSWFTKLPSGYLRIGISRSVPRGYPAGYRRIRALEPGEWFRSVTPAEYHRRYMEQLHGLDARALVDRIEAMAVGFEAAALVCFENPTDPLAWCHRGLVSAWLKDQVDLDVSEFGIGMDACCGWQHPKLFAKRRR